MSRNLSKQKQPYPETRSATPVLEDGTNDKGNDGGNRGDHNLKQSEQTYDQATIEIVLSPTPQHGHDIPSIESPVVAPFGVNETASHNISTRESSGKDSAELATGIHNLDIGNGKIHKPHTYASDDGRDLIPEQRNMQYFETSKFPVGALQTSYEVPAGSVPENMTEEDQLKWGQGEGINLNDLLSHFDKAFSKDDTEETVSDNKTSDHGIDKLPIHKRCTSSNVLGDQIEDVGGMDVNDGLPPWPKNSSGGPSAKDTNYSNEDHLSTSSVQLSGLRPTSSTRGDLNLLRPVSLSAVGHTVTTGDYTPSGAKLDSQVELVTGAEKRRDKSKTQDAAESWDTDIDFDLDDGARKMTDEDLITLGLQDGLPGSISDATTGLPPMTEEYWRELETEQNVRLFACDGPSEVGTGRVTAEGNAPADIKPPRLFVANASSLKSMVFDQPYNLFADPEPEPIQQEEAVPNMVDASGVPEMNDLASPMQDTTKDMPAHFGLRKWTGDDSVEPDIKYAKLVSSDSERLESSFASRDVSIMPWTACYPHDPDKARELEASTGVPGIRVNPVDVFFDTASNPQVLNEVDASQYSDSSRTELETQVSPRRPSND